MCVLVRENVRACVCERERKRVKGVMEIRICCNRASKRKRGGRRVPKRFGFE